MKLSYKTAWKTRLVLFIAGLAIMYAGMLLSDHTLSLVVGSLGVTVIIVGMAVYFLFGRCPVCKEFLKAHKWRSFRLPPSCSECGYELEQ